MDGPGRPVGALLGLPASECAVSVTKLSVEWSRTDAARIDMTIRDLPPGTYRYRATEQAPAEAVSAPGNVLTYLVQRLARYAAPKSGPCL